MIAALLHLHEGARAAVEARDQMRRGLAHRHDVVDDDARGAAVGQPRKLSACSFSALPSTWSTSGMAA